METSHGILSFIRTNMEPQYCIVSLQLEYIDMQFSSDMVQLQC